MTPKLLLLLAVLAVIVVSTQGQNAVLDCKDFDPKKIKLVTFDVFAALMDVTSSMNRNIAAILPQLSRAQVNIMTQSWLTAYSNYAGFTFDENVTGEHPFIWVVTTSLTKILTNMKITVTDDQFNALIQSWGNLIPWPGTTETLEKVYQSNFHIGTLSNGDKNTLQSAMSIFSPKVQFSYFFSSDFPVAGSFKPDAAMYNQLTKTTTYLPEEILHVAGANIDGWGSRSAGLFSALVGSPPYPQEPYPCFLLANITEVSGVLGIN